MSTTSRHAATYAVHAAGLAFHYQAGPRILEVRGDGETQRYSGADVDVAQDDFALLVTVCTLRSDRKGTGSFLTLALPRGMASESDGSVRGIVIFTRRGDLSSPRTPVAREVHPATGSVSEED
jgi:hypothetical protein